ncbi:hypothetical protein BC567DRAFT_215441 [Phyllosticta citribraziliensis]
MNLFGARSRLFLHALFRPAWHFLRTFSLPLRPLLPPRSYSSRNDGLDPQVAETVLGWKGFRDGIGKDGNEVCSTATASCL